MWKNVVAPMVLVVLFWLASSLTTTYYINWLEDSEAHSIKEDLTTVGAAGTMRYDLRQLYRLAVEAHRSDEVTLLADAQRLEADFALQLSTVVATSDTPPEIAAIQEIRKAYQPFRSEVHRWITVAQSPDMRSGQSVLDLTQLLDDVAEPCKQLSDINEQCINEAAAMRSRAASSINIIRLCFLIVGPAGGILCGLWIARRFHRSISRISISLSDVASQMPQPLGRIDLSPSGDLTHLQEQVQVVSGRIRQVVEELQQARRQAVASARLAAVGELAAGVAHELRNPMTAVKLLIQTAAQRNPGAPLAEKPMRVIQEEIARMESTIETLLQFARPPRMKRVPHDLRKTVRRALNLVEGRAEQAKVIVNEEISDAAAQVDADPEQLHQAVVNLLLNAIEAMDDGGLLTVRLRTEAADTEAAGGRCRLVIEDSGPGIPPQLLDRLFEPFVTGKEHGTGLGLAISRRIVQENGGVLSAANREGGGAVFAIELPALKNAERDALSKELNATVGTASAAASEQRRPTPPPQAPPRPEPASRPAPSVERPAPPAQPPAPPQEKMHA